MRPQLAPLGWGRFLKAGAPGPYAHCLADPEVIEPMPFAPGNKPMGNDDSESEPVEIKAGEEWLVLTCRNPDCRKTLLLEPVVPEILTDDGEVLLPIGNLEVTCPHCGSVFSYHSDEIRVEAHHIGIVSKESRDM